MYQKRIIAIYTPKVVHIDKTFKVMIDDKGYWVRLKESGFYFDSWDINIPTRYDNNHNSPTWLTDSEFEENGIQINIVWEERCHNNKISLALNVESNQTEHELSILDIRNQKDHDFSILDNLTMQVLKHDWHPAHNSLIEERRFSNKDRDTLENWR